MLERLWERQSFDMFPRMFIGNDPNEVDASASVGEGISQQNIELVSRLFRETEENGKVQEMLVPNAFKRAVQFKKLLGDALSQTEIGTQMLRVVKQYETTVSIFEADRFSFGCSFPGNFIWMTFPT